MKKLLFGAAVAAISMTAMASDVAMSISVGQPGFYGQIDIGGYPPPQVIYRQPRVAYRGPANRPPIYLHVPPGHARNWSKHCGTYNACNERVYFVKDNWYRNEYAPRYRERSDHRGNDHRNDQRDDDRNNHGNKGGNHGNKH